MTLSASAYRDAIIEMNGGPVDFVTASEQIREKGKELGVPDDVLDLVVENSVKDGVSFPDEAGGIGPTAEMVEPDRYGILLRLVDAGLFPVASAMNGDPIVIDMRDTERRAGFVAHDELPDEDADPRDHFVAVEIGRAHV